MRVRFRKPELAALSSEERFFVSPKQLFLSTGRDYPVYAVSVYEKVVFVQVVDDKETPTFLPRALFQMVDSEVPKDWICNLFPDGPIQMVLGPPFVAKDLDAYNAMIDQEAAQVERFWRRVEANVSSPNG